MNSRRSFRTVFSAILLLATGSAVAQAQNNSAADRLLTGKGESSPPSFSETTVDLSQGVGCSDADCCQPCCCPRWTASADFIIFDRIGSVNQTLVERVPGNVPLTELSNTFGSEALNSKDFQQGFYGGPRVGLIRHGDNDWDLELSFFQIDGWSIAKTIGPDNPPDWLVMRAPGGFLQTQDHATQAMAWEYTSRLDNAEINLRWNPGCPVTLLAGFRWVNLHENLQGVLVPPTFTFEPPFWNATTTNNLYGCQCGADGIILERGRFSMDGWVKAGIYDNNADETTGVSIFKVVRPSSASTNHAAFVGETGLQCKFQITKRLLLKAGYQAMWLEGVALAPGQIQETFLTKPKTENALGVNCHSGAFFHGGTAGLEYSF